MGFPRKLLLAEMRRAYLPERKEKHTLLTMILSFVGGLYSCLHAAERLASEQVKSNGLCFAARYNPQCHFLNTDFLQTVAKKGAVF